MLRRRGGGCVERWAWAVFYVFLSAQMGGKPCPSLTPCLLFETAYFEKDAISPGTLFFDGLCFALACFFSSFYGMLPRIQRPHREKE